MGKSTLLLFTAASPEEAVCSVAEGQRLQTLLAPVALI